MYRDRGGRGSKPDIGPLDRKRINDALDRQLERSSRSTPKGLVTKEKERLSAPSTSSLTLPPPSDSRDLRPASLSKNKRSDGELLHFEFR